MKRITDLVPINHSDQRVLTTAQLAEVYGTTPARLRDNFKSAKKHFTEGVDYFKVTGLALRQLKSRLNRANPAAAPIAKTANAIILWTASGILMHAKLLNTPRAWATFAKIRASLVDLDKLIFDVSTEPVEVQSACVYAFETSDNAVKIGVSNDDERRQLQLQRKGFEITRSYCTQNFLRATAFRLENQCHKHFADKRIQGEFFNITFEEAVAELERLSAFVESESDVEPAEVDENIAPQLDAPSDFERGIELVKLVAALSDSPLKERIATEAANLLRGKMFA